MNTTSRRLDCELPRPAMWSVRRDATGKAQAVRDASGRHLERDARELADIENGVYRVCGGRKALGHVEYSSRPVVAESYILKARREFESLDAGIAWVREAEKATG